MPFFEDQRFYLTAGGVTAVPLVGVQERGDYRYTYARSTAGGNSAFPGSLALVTTFDPPHLVGSAPTTENYTAVEVIATNRAGHRPQDPDAPYYAHMHIHTGYAPMPVVTPETLFNTLAWRDQEEQQYRIGIRHSNPRARYLFMGIPTWARAGYGPTSSPPPGSSIDEQWMAIENIQQLILPRITSNVVVRTALANEGDYLASNFTPPGAIGSGRPSGMGPTSGRAAFRTFVRYGPARLRVIWNEDYASHGGPYGLRQLALNQGAYVPFAYYERAFPLERGAARALNSPDTGRVLLVWNGFVGEFVETVSFQGITVDCVIYPETGLTTRQAPATVRADGESYGFFRWPARPRHIGG